MRPIRDIDLMRLADDEVTAAERAELEAALAASPDARDKLAALGHLGEAIRGDLELAADAAEPRLDRLWAEIDKRIDLEAPAPRPNTVLPAPEPGLWARFGRWIDTYRGHVLTGALSAGAVAAIALVMRPDPHVIEKQTPAPPQIAVKPPVTPTVEPDTMVATHTPAEVEELDVADGTSTVFTIEGDDGEQTTVIWVTPEDTLEGL